MIKLRVMLDRYPYLDRLERLRNSPAGFRDGLERLNAPAPLRSKKARAERVHHSRTQEGSTEETLVLIIGLISVFAAVGATIYQFAL